MRLYTPRILSFFLALCPFLAAEAAQPLYSVSGRVTDAATGEPVTGAVVMVKDTYKGTETDMEGRWRLDNLAAGDYTFAVSFISYKSIEVSCRVAADVEGVDVRLESDSEEVEEVVVKARMRSDTEIAMLGTIKAVPQVTSGVSAAQISKSPDRNASEVVRRVPGITIIDDRFIIVRGLSQRYNNAWINGLAVPSTETDSRAFSFDMIPSSQIDNLLVYKSPSPEIPGDFSGGFVKIVTKGIPEENSIEVGYSTGFNVRTQFRQFRMNPGSCTDFLGFDLGKRPLGRSFPAHMDLVTSPDEITRLTREGFNNDWRIRSFIPMPDQRLSFSMARRWDTKHGRTVGNITAVTYSNTFKGVEGIKNARYGIYSAAADTPIYLDDYYDNQYSNDVRLGAMHNWAFILDASNRIEFKNLLNILGRNRLTERRGIKDMSSMYYLEQTEMQYSSRLTYTGQFSGTHHLAGTDATVTWDAGYSYADRNEPDRRIVSNMAGIGSTDDLADVVTGNDNIKRYFQTLGDHIASASGNYVQQLAWGGIRPTLKAGIYGEYRYRSYDQREFIYRYDNLSAEERQYYLKLPFQEMLSPEWLGADKVYIDEITRKTNAYTADIYYGAAYAALDIPLGKFDIYAGARLESYTTKLTRDRSDAPELILMTTKTHHDLNLLPSVNVTYRIDDRHQLRAAYGRSLNRPELRELSPTVYYDFDLFSEIAGNENLRTAVIDNVDLRYEFYPAPGETVSLGAFYKHFRNPIEWTYIDMGGSLRYMYENADRAQSWGVELDVRKNLGFIGMPNLSLVLNAVWIYSNVTFVPGEVVSEPDRPMQGQSPYVINAGLYYSSERLGLDVALLYNRIGKRIVGLGKSNSVNPDPNTLIPDSYEMPRNVLDFSVSKRIGRRVTLSCSVKDLLSEDVVYKQFPKFEKDGQMYRREQVTRRYNPGQSVSLTVSVKL